MPGIIFFIFCFISAAAISAPVTQPPSIQFKSAERQTHLLELYTSEGCSSCPPADRWLSTLLDDPRLWKDIIPIAFHVDYWNYIGWQDRFSSAANSERQRSHANYGNVRSVYTPGFILSGREWRAWFKRPQIDANSSKNVGPLTVTIKNDRVVAEFVPSQSHPSTLKLNHAWLGFDLVTEVKDGENEGRTLKHDFVSYDWQQRMTEIKADRYRWEFPIAMSSGLPEKKALVFWVSEVQNPKPLQATGGWYKIR